MTQIRRLGPADGPTVMAAAHLFDGPPLADATERFLAADDHHILLAVDGEAGQQRAVGMVTGVETTHPDKGTEMFLYELAVDEAARGRGVGRALVEALGDLARGRGCYGMWVAVDADNGPALATYRSAGAVPDDGAQHVLTWDLRPATEE